MEEAKSKYIYSHIALLHTNVGWFFLVRTGLWRKLRAEKLMLLNCGVEKTLESPLDCKELQPVHPKGDQSWVFIGRTDAEAETPILWPPHVKCWLIGKDPDAGRNRGQEEKGTTEDEMAEWQHPLNGHEFEWTRGVGDGQGGLACCDSWGRKESDMTEWLNWTELKEVRVGGRFNCSLSQDTQVALPRGQGACLLLTYPERPFLQMNKSDNINYLICN